MHRARPERCAIAAPAAAAAEEIAARRDALRTAADRAVSAGGREAARRLRIDDLTLRELAHDVAAELRAHCCDPAGDAAAGAALDGLRRAAAAIRLPVAA